jgi:hypothetical protein
MNVSVPSKGKVCTWDVPLSLSAPLAARCTALFALGRGPISILIEEE